MPDGFHEIAADADVVRAAVTRGLVNHSISGRDMPVAAIRLYRRDAIVTKSLPAGVIVGKFGTGGARGAIEEFSMKSRYRLLHTIKNASADFFCMLTVTYPAEFSTDGRQVKRHLFALKKRIIRKWPEIQGVWFLEFQRRGAPHFHVLLSLKLWEVGPLVERTRRHNKLGVRKYRTHLLTEQIVSRWWFEIVGSGDEKHLRAGVALECIEEENGALRYAACHASKPHQKRVPKDYQNVGRFWGVIGGVKASLIDVIPASAEMIFETLGADAMSRKGRVKKYLWDASQMFTGAEE